MMGDDKQLNTYGSCYPSLLSLSPLSFKFARLFSVAGSHLNPVASGDFRGPGNNIGGNVVPQVTRRVPPFLSQFS